METKIPTTFLAILCIAIVITFFLIFPQQKVQEKEVGKGPQITAGGTEKEEIPVVEEKIPGKETVSKDYEGIYSQNSKFLNKTHDFGLFETRLTRIGFYTYYNNISEKEEEYFRADIWVRNAGNAAESFNTDKAFLRLVPNTYNVSSGGNTFNGYNVSPGEERAGYILFENVPETIAGNLSITIGTAASYNTIFNTIGQFPFTYVVGYP